MHSPASAAPPRLDRKAVGAVVLGNALEFYDFTIYAFFAKSIGATFFPSDSPTDSLLASLALFGIGYVMRPVGGVLIGAFADRAGRKPAMLITIALMAVGMLMLAACPGTAVLGVWAQVIVIAGRLIQGLALGGEVGPSTAFLIEAAPARHRGFVASWQIASQGCAALFATVLTLVLGDTAMADWGWRLMFGLGLLVVPVGLVIRSHLPETAGEGHDPAAADSTGAVLGRLLRQHGRMLGLTFLVIAASTVSNAVGTNMPVYAGATLGLSEMAANAVPIALGLASVIFPLLGGWLADRFGRKPVMIWPRALILLLAVPTFLWMLGSPSAYSVYAVTFLLSALSSVNAAAIIVAIPEALPRAVRSAGLSIVYALSVSIFGGSTNYVVNWLIAATGDRMAPAYYLAAFSLVGTVAALLLPETRGRDIHVDTATRR
ncbi:UNVERIFIED_ORG: MFS family permease [Methylobacterium sp. SuP10 SLI 274]|uniref:MFS transporter n=1 Tax=Methylorubrum extorquens TaxID=408 RepID=UPI00209E0C2C|nr:MFS transporter [Methylorubrum extorquens]MDF9865447.1 MFS family permease [Methylorubrum pseudosasae]MDH6639017.1 MFS family permease [Methylobacterium sp. SuP10 SLI 274]MDH6668205.1 MFS family permease [Methylorubrum zatmanii]MCP1560093.1 MFS family permease [Methylorubrum extorquens]MDF9793748.1 MFS family permease [Methylorubrum extorquens]